MANTAIISFDSRSNKWTATYNGRVLASSANKDYVVNSIVEGRCGRAKAVNVTMIQEVGETKVNAAGQVEKIDRFGINERFDFLTDFVNMVADRTSASLVVTGEGGLGKTFTVNKALKNSNMKELSEVLEIVGDGDSIPLREQRKMYAVVKGFSTAKGLYRTLYENRNRVVVFDDCDSILRDPVALNVLKGALDSYDVRIISWHSEGFGASADDLPRSFKFDGGVIFISNLPISKIDQAVRSRSICVDLSMNLDQKIERMRAIAIGDEFMPEFENEVKQEAINFIDEMKSNVKELSLRTLISVIKVASRGGDWKRRAEYLMTAI